MIAINKSRTVLLSLIIAIFFGCQPAAVSNDPSDECTFGGSEVLAKAVNNRSYYPAVFDLFENAEKTINVIMYDMKYYDYDPETEESKLLSKLAQASLRGVEVKIILEQSDWNSDVNEDNYASGAYLMESGVLVRYDPMTITTHCKMMIIDSVYTLVGSTNWSKSAINYNNEANVLMTGNLIAEEFIDYFNVLWSSSYEREF